MKGKRACAFWVVVVAALAGFPCRTSDAAVTKFSGTCVMDLTGTISGGALELEADPDGLCATTDLLGTPGLGVTIPGIVAFDCQKGAGRAVGGFGVSFENWPDYSFASVEYTAVLSGGVLALGMLQNGSGAVLVGNGTFVAYPESIAACLDETSTMKFTGNITFTDPWVE